MNCPVCPGIDLVRTPYEGVLVDLCPSCHGFLLSPNSLKNIERNPEMSQEVLEAETQLMADTVKTVTCPKCRISMQKKYAPHGLDFNIDVCRCCNLIWLDGGELESIQLAYEASPAGQDNIRRRQEMANMSEERRMQLQAGIDKAPDRRSMLDHDDRMRYGNYRGSGLLVDWIISSLFKL